MQSAKAILGLDWISKKNNIVIQHAKNGLEARAGPYKIDGKCGNTAYEFYGCYWHGCPKCVTDRNKMIANGTVTAREAYLRTMERKYYLVKEHSLKVVELWECQLHEMLEKDAHMKEFFKSHCSYVEPLNPRNAFYGGRTNAVKLYHKVKQDERIRYADVCSLYPYTNKYGKYPVGHPKIITEGFEQITKEHKPYEGLIKCMVIPPKNLYHPVLPFRAHGKLLFPLCEKCAKEQRKEYCTHSENHRALCGTWVTCELYKAVDVGYKVTKIFEVWHYDIVSQYDRTEGSGGLFGDYVNTFMKLKMEAEGWPTHCKDQSSRAEYIREVLSREDIEMDPQKVEKNPGKRALAKLMLNSFWGKFGQKNNQIKTVYFTDPKEYFNLVFDVSTNVHSITIISDYLVSVTFTQKNDFVDILPYTNPVIAAYTTAQARLTLYSYLEKLDRRVLYFDTDSVIYLEHANNSTEYKIPIGWSLGEMTNELKDYGQDAFIAEFASGGPKNYAYAIFSPVDGKWSFVTKVRGITLTKMASKRVNFKSLKCMVCSYVRGQTRKEIQLVSHQIGRRREGHQVVTGTVSKKFRVVYDKRILLKNFYTVPYGWQSTAEDVINIVNI